MGGARALVQAPLDRWFRGASFLFRFFALTSLVFELWGKNGANLVPSAVLHGDIFYSLDGDKVVNFVLLFL